MHIVVCGDIAYPTISGVSRISAKGVLQVRLNMEGVGGGGGGGGLLKCTPPPTPTVVSRD